MDTFEPLRDAKSTASTGKLRLSPPILRYSCCFHHVMQLEVAIFVILSAYFGCNGFQRGRIEKIERKATVEASACREHVMLWLVNVLKSNFQQSTNL